MKLVLPLLLLSAAMAGCEMRTLSPDDFLFTYRCGAPPGEPAAGATATYAGRDQTFQYIASRGSTPTEMMLSDMSGERKFRCRADQLPDDFPADFVQLRGPESFEAAEDTRQYVQEYLANQKAKQERASRQAQ
jgi:hypothetical protein